MATDPRLPYERTFDALYGLEGVEIGEDWASGRVQVRDEVRQPMGIVHGGVYAAATEALTSMATWAAVRDDGLVAMGISNQTSYLRPIADGTIHLHAKARHRGRTTWVWEVEVTDDQGRLCVLSRVTVAVREPPSR